LVITNSSQNYPITDNQTEYAQTILDELKKNHIRVEIDTKSETMQNKIRNAAGQKIPYMIIVGGAKLKTKLFLSVNATVKT